ncbi:AcrR family transcriptional regulator [Bradyrhizobium sp. USDA 4509]
MRNATPAVHGLESPAFIDQPPSVRALAYSALNEFDKHGFHAASTRAICSNAGLSTGALYAHFRSKEEILFWWINNGHSEGLKIVEDAVQSDGPAIARLARLVREFTVMCTRNPTAIRVTERDLNALSDEHFKQVIAKRRRLNRLTTSLIEQAVSEKSIAPSDVRLATLTVLTYTQTIIRWYGATASYDKEKLTDNLCRAILRVCGVDEVDIDAML